MKQLFSQCMNSRQIKHELEKQYPGKKIIFQPPDNPTEIICEIDPSSVHPEHSTVIAVIDKSAVHYHQKSTEIYEVIRGQLDLFTNGEKKVLKTGEKYEIKPYTIHWATGNETWVKTSSNPGWIPTDHILVGKEEQINISPYNPLWSDEFTKEKTNIEKCLGSWIFGDVHHVGSTSVIGLSAKPIIDIMVGVKNLVEAKPCIDMLAQIHYQYFPYKPEIMHWFCKPSLEHRTHHLYLMEPNSLEWKARLVFRDYLRTHPDTGKAYMELKLSLAEKFKNDREAYTDAKTEFIKSIVQKYYDQPS
jgi:GrpB-like predicted nucleotidyltransferase (UPF0157 family)